MNRFKVLIWGSFWLAPLFLFSQISGSEGQLLKIETFHNYTVSDSTPLTRIIYEYPTATKRIVTSYGYDSGEWVGQTRFDYTQDAQGRTIETVFERYESATQSFSPQTRTLNFPRGNSPSLLDSVLTYNWSENQSIWELSIVLKNRFNASNQLIESETNIMFFGQSFLNKDVKFYDAAGNQIRVENYTISNGQLVFTGFTRYEFTAGNLVKYSRYVPAPPPLDSIPISQSTYTYNPDNSIKSSEDFTFDLTTMTWVKIGNSAYTYNSRGQLQSLVVDSRINNQVQINRTDYFYTPNGNTAREERYSGSGEPVEWTLESKTFYTYDVASGLKAIAIARPIKISPNPASDQVRLDLSPGTYFQIFNTQGQIQDSGMINGQNSLAIQSWPSGLYWVLARKNNEVFLGKILKQ